MEVFVHNIPNYVDSNAIERFIFAVVQKEKDFVLPLRSFSHTSTPSPNYGIPTAAIPINKGFFFKRIERGNNRNLGVITFARTKVGAWFLQFAQLQSFARNHGLRLVEGRDAPSKAFVQAISENASDKQPSASVQKHAQTYRFSLAHVGFWTAKMRFCYTQQFIGQQLRLVIDERSVIEIHLDRLDLSFLPRDVRGYNCAFINTGTVQSNQVGAIFLFELRQNPQMSNPSTSTSEYHGFALPSRVIRIAFSADERGAHAADRLYQALETLLAGVPRINMRQVQMTGEKLDGFIDTFFQRSKNLNIELAFHREALLRNELLNISALRKISPLLEQMIHRGQQALALRVLRNFLPKLETRQERGRDEEQALKMTFRLWEESCAEAVANDSRGLFTFPDPSEFAGDDYMSPMLHIDVTPTRILLSGPQWHVSNRVIRAYPEHWHHFARVMFTNEDRESVTTIKPNYGFRESEEYIQSRVLDVLMHGINVAGRHYDLLAWSSSSMSTHTVWFVTPFKDEKGNRVDANVIRRSLGDFSDVIREPARYGARLSQAFSATARTVEVPVQLIHSRPDKFTHDGQIFTDGVGQISPALMADVWESYVTIHGEHRKRKLLKASAPSAIQIRLGGNKGVLAVNPRLRGKAIIVRPSMSKFGSAHFDLEVANASSRCLSAKLNRPLVNALGDRGVSPAAFLEIQAEAIALIGRARSNFHEAARLCSAYSFGTGVNLHALFEKVSKLGLGANTVHSDSFFLTIAKAVTAAALGDMKRKTRIPVKGVTLLGIADEFNFLKEGEIFVQVEMVDSGNVVRRILTGRNLIGRSPTIDPSDIAMVTCVKPPAGHPLLQLRNVVVFDTCSRIQPLPRRLGGGDLDGDLYTVYEDPRLFPPSEHLGEVFHEKTRPVRLPHDCGPHDLAIFFSEFMLNDFIGLVSHLHLRISDASDHGSHDPRCKELARLHSQATDFRKTGVAVKRDEMPRHNEPIVPDFLAQGETREGQLTYSSKRVLGYLFRAVSWNETDTPSLDKNTDPETGLVTIGAADCLDDDDIMSEYGSEISSLIDEQGTSQPIRLSSLRATVGSFVPGTNEPVRSLPSGASAAADPAAASRWQFKDVTFPPLLEKIGSSYSFFLDGVQSLQSTDEAKVIEEGHRYVPLFQDFTRQFRQVSRMIASYHPDVDRPWDGLSGAEAPLGGTLLVSEVHLLTGRLPWSKATKKTRIDRDNTTMDSMRALCTMLRKHICSVSEAAAFGKKSRSDAETSSGLHPEDPLIVSEDASDRSGQDNAAEVGQVDCERSVTPSHHLHGRGTALDPIELLSSDDEDTISDESDSTIDGAPARTSAPVKENGNEGSIAPGLPSAPLSDASPSAGSNHEAGAAVKRKASQEAGTERRRSMHTPTPLQIDALQFGLRQHGNGHEVDSMAGSPASSRPASPLSPFSQASPTLSAFDTAAQEPNGVGNSSHQTQNGKTRAGTAAGSVAGDDEEEEEEGELTARSAQKIVNSLWKACLFFCSPRRARYSNVYGYNTFFITLILHLLSMLDTLKHLHRNPYSRSRYQRKRAPSDASSTATYATTAMGDGASTTGEGGGRIDRVAMRIEVEDEEEEVENAVGELDRELDRDYSLTEAAMAALDLGTLLLDLGANDSFFD